jgi:CubicO group peptidase (beta-lactamase class C family)
MTQQAVIPSKAADAQSLRAVVEAGLPFLKGGEVVVDLWAGWADAAKTVPYGERTLTPVFSTGKAVMMLLIASCVERGLLDYERPVAGYWPAFGQAGKAAITVGQMMSHQAGLPGFSESVDPSIWFDRTAALARLCEQAPMWEPGTESGYHPITIGLLAGELFRIVDGRSMGTALREDFPGLDLWIGLPEAEHGRVAQMRKPAAAPDLGVIDAVKRAAFLDSGSAPGGRGSAEWRTMELPSANLHGTARDLARIMGVVVDGTLEGRTVLSPDVRAGMLRDEVPAAVVIDLALEKPVLSLEDEDAGHFTRGGIAQFGDL